MNANERPGVEVEGDVEPSSQPWSRRRALQALVVMGIGTDVFRRSLAAAAEGSPKVTSDMVQRAEWVSGLEFSDDQRTLMLDDLNRRFDGIQSLREVQIGNGVPPALNFLPQAKIPPNVRNKRAVAEPIELAAPRRPTSEDDLAYLPITELAALLRTGRVSSVELTRMYLERLRRYDPLLHCVITLTEESALRQARQADREIAAGRYRGALHGIPWGAKDLLAFPDYPTTWGAKPYKDQDRAEKATVISRLEEAGAVLVAKLAVGALAWGDVWFDGKTRNPWNVDQGSSGSSAGPAAAVAAGLVGFGIGTETWGSIVSPCTRCGATGLRPTFGRVSRYGCMALSWSMDKIGPITRSVEDAAIVFSAIHGRDGLDDTAVDQPFSWPPRDVRTLRVGFVESMFDQKRLENVEDEERRSRLGRSLARDRRVLDVLRSLGVKLTPIKLPDKYPIRPLGLILTAEAATAFDDLTRSGRVDELVRQTADAWPNVFRHGQLIPAVEYLRANRVRTLIMQEMERMMNDVDVYVAPSFGGNNLLLTNLTGHPAVVVPHGFREKTGNAGLPTGTPTSITFTGKLFGESDLLAVAHAYQQATDFHLERPPLSAASETPK